VMDKHDRAKRIEVKVSVWSQILEQTA